MEIHQTSIFMHDRAPCHRSKIVSKWLDDNKMSVLDCPGNNSDLSPIENMWMIIKIRLNVKTLPLSQNCKRRSQKCGALTCQRNIVKI